MESFNYLSVLLSIILGLAIMQVLQGFRGLILTRAKVKLYGPTLIWSGLTLLMVIQGWWASFGMRTHANWTFAAFIVVILHAISVYMVAALVFPDITGESIVDLPEHYFAHRNWFFGFLFASIVLSAFAGCKPRSRSPAAVSTGCECKLLIMSGEGGIRTHESLAALTVFKISERS